MTGSQVPALDAVGCFSGWNAAGLGAAIKLMLQFQHKTG
jgi:hypothetical protein